MLFRVQVVPGVLKCRRRTCKLPQHGLDPRIACYITEAGFEGLFKVPNLELDHAFITALVERWRPEMHTFHLPYGEMGITLQDIEVMLGVRVDGLPMTEGVKMNWPTLCFELLGHRPPDSIPHPHENMSILAGARLRFTWLDAQFRCPLVADATDEVVQQYALSHTRTVGDHFVYGQVGRLGVGDASTVLEPNQQHEEVQLG